MSESKGAGMSTDDKAAIEGMVVPSITLSQLADIIYDAREVLAEMADDVAAVGMGPDEVMARLVTRAAGLPGEFRFPVTDAIRDVRTATSVEHKAAAWQLGKIQAVKACLAGLLAQEEAAAAGHEEGDGHEAGQRTCAHCGVVIVPDPALVSMWLAAGMPRPGIGEGGPRPGLCGGTGGQNHEPAKQPQPWIARRSGDSYGVWNIDDGGWLVVNGTIALYGKAEAQATAARLSGEA